ncbi:class I SAM-dependent methyltransferase [Candidatus Woesearchaeota archaeon]|nr:class I SAM-dependent methyltransferase [Candidatus Woesearchaeota archaeon]
MERVKCSLCGLDNAKLLFRGRDAAFEDTEFFNLVQCRNCGLAYVNPRPSPKEIGKYYPDVYYSKFVPDRKGSFVKSVRRIILETYFGYGKAGLFRKMAFFPFYIFRSLFLSKGFTVPCVKKGRFLDVGFGGGSLLYEYKALGWDVYGTEVSDRMIRNAAGIGARLFKGELRDAKFDGDFFDAVYMSHVLEHVHEPYSVMVEIRRILRPGGSAFVVLPNFGSLESRLLRDKWFVGLQIPRHLYHFSPSALKKLCLKAGFRRVDFVFMPDQTTLLGSLQHLWLIRKLRINLFSRFFLVFFLPLTFLLSVFHQSGIFAVYLRK